MQEGRNEKAKTKISNQLMLHAVGWRVAMTGKNSNNIQHV